MPAWRSFAYTNRYSMTIRLLLGDQLNQQHSWFQLAPSPTVRYVLMEMRQETDYAEHHIQKVLAFFAAMRSFAEWLRAQGHLVTYITLDDAENTQQLLPNLAQLVKAHHATRFEYQLPDEYRLDVQLATASQVLGVPTQAFDTEHFLTTRPEVATMFAGKKTYLMETFYRQQRKRFGILMDAKGNPEGGQWNFDHDNRQALPPKAAVPAPYFQPKDLTALHTMVVQAGVRTMGTVNAAEFIWPTSRPECLALLEQFATTSLPQFGTYEDAMSSHHWLLFHARLSFALNSKQLSPAEVIDRCVAEYRARPDEITLPQIEGFVRQIAGWREYMRGIYWAEMPAFAALNYFSHKQALPALFWTGETKMNCLRHALGQSLEHAYAHHIQRLMVIGNFALLMGAHPDAVDAWYLGVYIDALEWVEITNTRGMSQFADGGIVGTKPYVSSAAYINKMSDYCKGCAYNYKEKLGEKACPFNSLYWHFYARHRPLLERNPRIGYAYQTWDRMALTQQQAILNKAEEVLANLETL